MSLKVKLISCISLFMLVVGVLIIGVFAATQQQLTMEGSVSFNVPDKSLYVKDVRIKQDMASEPTSIDSFMPGYINGDFTLDLTGITDTNTHGSFSLYFDIINTTDIQWTITDVYLPDTLTSQGVSASYSGVIATNDLTDTDSDGYKNFDSSTPIDGSLILTIAAPNSSSVNLEGIVVTIDEYVPEPNIIAISSNETLGIAQGAFAEIGDEVTISADFTGNANADFLGWRAGSVDGELVSTLSDYTFTYTEESPTTYYAIFTEPNKYLTYTNYSSSGTVALRNCTAGATDIIVPSEIYRTSQSASYVVTSLYSATSSSSGVFYQARSTLQSVSFPETITSIGSYAFSYCSGLTSITIPKNVTNIGSSAFESCSGLETITVEEGNTVYHSAGNCLIETATKTLIKGCNNSIIPDDGSVTSVDSSAFNYCSGLTSITLPSSLESIGSNAFRSCDGLTSIILPSSLESIGSYAFSYCSGLTSITIPESVTSIGSSAFSGCSGLETITVEEGNTVYHSAGNCLIETASGTLVRGCNNSVIPQDGSVTSIGSSAFQYCDGLTSITLPSSLESIGSSAFQYCDGLTSITLPSNLESIGSRAFDTCSGLTSIDLSDCTKLTSIGSSVFFQCRKLTSIDLSGCTRLTSIDSTFANCYGLISITLPSSLENIGSRAFYYCSDLTSITLPSELISIGNQAFYLCRSLTSITINATTPPTLGSSAIPSNVTSIYVPTASVATYQSASGWSSFASKISAIQ